MRTYRISFGLALMFCLVAIGEEPPRVFSAVVEGQVLNLEGSPIPDADVLAVAIGIRDRGRTARVRASRQGQFSLGLDRPGRYVVLASQEKEGYASAFFPTYGVPAVPLPEVFVDESQTLHSVVIRLGPKPGKFAGRVFDAVTGQPVEKGQVELQVRSLSNALLRQRPYSRGQFQFWAPPSLFSLRVSAPGYEDWYGNGSKEQPETFAIQLGDRQEITVLLRPATTR